ncbi:MAG TPA: GNAT family N-acetyltransferase [Gammaproteobacteria bacterium]|jgi:ribosomal protein S18 acetylase RimI-like enzyme|nr:GNAT family N-acetyltransferase [Gammaproteobacteria bacterium]
MNAIWERGLMEENLPVIILPMHSEDVDAVSKIHAEQFVRQNNSQQWITCNFAAYPRIMLFVARDEKDKVIGYIQWIQKSGFRKQAVFELEQIAVSGKNQSCGVGTLLIKQSLEQIKNYLRDSHSSLKAVLVSTRTDNAAAKLYETVLGAKKVAEIKSLYSHDEVIMLADSF